MGEVAVIDVQRAEEVAHRRRIGQGGAITQLKHAATDRGGTRVSLGTGQKGCVVTGTCECEAATDHTTEGAAARRGEDCRRTAGDRATRAGIRIIVIDRTNRLVLTVQVDRASIGGECDGGHRRGCRSDDHGVGSRVPKGYRATVVNQGTGEVLRCGEGKVACSGFGQVACGDHAGNGHVIQRMEEQGIGGRGDLATCQSGVASQRDNTDGTWGENTARGETRESTARIQRQSGFGLGGEAVIAGQSEVRRRREHVRNAAECLIGSQRTETGTCGVGQEAGTAACNVCVANHVGTGADVCQTCDGVASIECDGRREHV